MSRGVKRSGATAAEAAGWAATIEATNTSREQLTYLLEQPKTLDLMGARFSNLESAQEQGHYFEWLHELGFNLDAIRHGSEQRLWVTEWLGRPHDPADLHVLDGSGSLLGQAQAKVVASPAQRLSFRDGLSAAKYDGMDLLVPSDHVDTTRSLLDRRLDMPEGPLHERYRDVLDRVTDRVQALGISSDPVSTEKLAHINEDPSGFLVGLIDDNRLHQAILGLVAAGGTATMSAMAVDVAKQRIADGDYRGIAWTEAALRAAKVGAVAAVVGAGGTLASTHAQEAVVAGSGGHLADVLAGGDLAFAMARGAMAVAHAAHGFATGRLTAVEAATASTEGITRTVSVWACASVGQSVIPIPVVGAMIGGLVGQYGATMMVQGLHLALLARDTSAEWDDAYELLLAETDAVIRDCEEERRQLTLMAQRYDVAFTRQVIPALNRIEKHLWTGDPDRVLREFADLALLYSGMAQFSSLAEFDAFMFDTSTTLVLDLGNKMTR